MHIWFPLGWSVAMSLHGRLPSVEGPPIAPPVHRDLRCHRRPYCDPGGSSPPKLPKHHWAVGAFFRRGCFHCIGGQLLQDALPMSPMGGPAAEARGVSMHHVALAPLPGTDLCTS